MLIVVFSIYKYYNSVMKSASQRQIAQVARAMVQRRIALKLKQADVVQKTGIALSTLQKFEQTGHISLERFMRLAYIYRISQSVLRGIESRDGWSLEEIKRAENRRKIR